MGRIVASRILLLPFVLLGVSLVLFAITQIIPSDPVRLMVGDQVDPVVRAQMEEKLGLHKPLIEQYGGYLSNLLHGDMGTSIRYAVPVKDLLLQAFPATMTLVAAAMVFSILLTFPLGYAAARFKNTFVDVLIRGFSILGTATPPFYFAILCILVFGFHLGWFPITGRGDPPDLHHLILPAFILGYSDAGHSVRVFRASLVDSLQEDYVRAARARGIGGLSVLFKHSGRNALIPTTTVLGLSLASIAGSLILVETVFSWPGVGRLVEIGILWNDFPLVTGALLVLLAYTVIVSAIVDILYVVIDPRIRTHSGA